MTITNKELFINAFLEAEQITNKDYLNKDDFNFEFSDEFNKKMKKLIAKESRISFNHRKRISRALIVAIIATIIMFTGLMSVSASRQKIIEFIETIFPKYTQVELSEESAPTPETIETAYTLGYVPEGYILKEYTSSDVNVFAVWTNENGDEIVFFQNLLDSNISIDNEHYYKTIEINGNKAYLCIEGNTFTLLWSDGFYYYRIYLPAELKEKSTEIVKNIIKKY